MIKILAVDDDDIFCYALKRIAGRMEHEFASASTIKAALDMVSNTEFDLILLDVGLPDGNGLSILPRLKQLPSRPEVVIITGAGDAQGAELAITNGAWDYLEKTASSKTIALTMTRVIQYRKEKQKSKHLTQVTPLKRDTIIGASPEIKKCLEQVAKAAECRANVLITGDTGTGKELFARAIHENSLQADREIIVVDCASLPENLAENLLFGHEKGVYTGADKEGKGLIQMADKGTLFLDEIGELTLPLQKKFLRVLQEKKFRPLGSKKEIQSDFRIIAATNKDLDAMADQGSFRKDLIFRIRSLHIDLPRLKNRKGDIKLLARHYLDIFCEAQIKDSKGVSSDFFDVISAYSWPGNVRELAHTMEHVVVSALNEPTVYSRHLPESIRVKVVTSALSQKAKPSEDQAPEYNPDAMPKIADYRDEVIIEHEKKYLKDLMQSCKGHIKTACTVSGLSRSRLYTLLKKHQISG